MKSKVVTLEVSKLDKSKDNKDLQSENIWPNPVTWEVLKLDKSKYSNEEQFQNILCILSVTFDVSKFDKFNDFSILQL